MDNEEIPEYEPKDPFLCVSSLRVCAKHWAGDLDVRDWRISPIFYTPVIYRLPGIFTV